MKIVLLILGLMAVVALVAAIAGVVCQARRAKGISDRLQRAAAPVDVSARLPEPVLNFALRADANPADLAHSVRMTQDAEMQLKPDGNWQPLTATQVIATGAPGFVWQASQYLGPLSVFKVIDAYVAQHGLLHVKLFGIFPVVKASGADIGRSQALRYLAELPWAPDAMLGNPDLRWRMRDDGWAEVALDTAGGPASVRFCFDEAGDIAEVLADARDTTDDAGNPAKYPWHGFFRDYRMIGPRRIPAEAEVGYIRPGGYRPYFQGRITGYDAVH